MRPPRLRMNWRNKARIAAAVAKLPPKLSFAVYYFIQRRYGTLKQFHPIRYFQAGLKMVSLLQEQRGPLNGSETFLEVGTGRSLALPLALWLCGAKRIITVDVHPYLKEQLVLEQLQYLREHREQVAGLFTDHLEERTFRERMAFLEDSDMTLAKLLAGANIQYLAPINAAQLDLPSQSIDYHVSFQVLQHVTPKALIGIFLEGKRLLKPAGLFIHYTVLDDLFSGVDRGISPVNFLQFSDAEWENIAGNRFMYHNRLRADDLNDLLIQQGLKVALTDVKINRQSLQRLQDKEFVLDQRFRQKSPQTNATESLWVVATPQFASGQTACQVLTA